MLCKFHINKNIITTKKTKSAGLEWKGKKPETVSFHHKLICTTECIILCMYYFDKYFKIIF